MIIEIILITLLILLAAFAFILHQNNVNLARKIRNMTVDPNHYGASPEEQLIITAKKQADQLIQEAEINALKLASDQKENLQNYETNMEKELAATSESVKQQVEAMFAKSTQDIQISLDNAKKKHDEFMMQLQKQDATWQRMVEDEMRGKINELFIEFEQKLTDFLANAENKSVQAISLEVKSARELIDNYKAQQIGLVDENIVAVLERTMTLVLGKKLSLKDQLEMVYQSLEQAKVEKFFA